MKTNPWKVSVCPVILILLCLSTPVRTHGASDIGAPNMRGDALSADSSLKRDHISSPKSGSKSYSATPLTSGSRERGRSHTHISGEKREFQRESITAIPLPDYPVSVRGTSEPATADCAQPQGGFCDPGVACGPVDCGPYLPRPGCRHFHVAAKLWYVRLNNSKIIWGSAGPTTPGTELDLVKNLGVRRFEYQAEYEITCKVRPNWGIRYSFMPLAYRDNTNPTQYFYFGNVFYPAGYSTLTRWNRNIHRWDLSYEWYDRPQALSTIFGGYSLYDDKLVVSNILQSRTRSSGFGLAHAGMTIERSIRDLAGGAHASMNCKWSVQFLEGYLGWDGYVGGRVAVPFDNGRYGYLEAGWRWVELRREYTTNADVTNLDGLMGTVGVVF